MLLYFMHKTFTILMALLTTKKNRLTHQAYLMGVMFFFGRTSKKEAMFLYFTKN